MSAAAQGAELFEKSPRRSLLAEGQASRTLSGEFACHCSPVLISSTTVTSTCYYCMKTSDGLISFGSFKSCRPCMKKVTLKSDRAKASFPFVRKDGSRNDAHASEVTSNQSIDGDKPAFGAKAVDNDEASDSDDSDREEVKRTDSGEDEDDNGDSDEEKAGGEGDNGDSDEEKAGGEDDNRDSDEEKAGGEGDNGDSDEEKAGGEDDNGDSDEEKAEDEDDSEDGDGVHEEMNSFNPNSPPTPQVGRDRLLESLATRPESFEAISVFQEPIKYTTYRPFDELQPFDAGKMKHYVSTLVSVVLKICDIQFTLLNLSRSILTLRHFIFITRSLRRYGTLQNIRLQSPCRCTE